MRKVQLEFSTLLKLQGRFSTMWKEWVKISSKTRNEIIIFHNVQGKYRTVIALKWFATESYIQLI